MKILLVIFCLKQEEGPFIRHQLNCLMMLHPLVYSEITERVGINPLIMNVATVTRLSLY